MKSVGLILGTLSGTFIFSARMSLSGLSPDTSAGYDRTKDLKAFYDTKAGVKGLVDAGIRNIPEIFI